MDRTISSRITKMKRPSHNIYGLNSFKYKVSIALGISIWVSVFFDIAIRSFSLPVQVAIWILTFLTILGITFTIQKERSGNFIPYSRQENFEFLGLYNLNNVNLDKRNDVLTRDEEVEYMHQVLEEIIFPQVSVKQALCLTGPSGSGKSSILTFFNQTYKDKYSIFDFSGNYHEFEGHMVSLFGTHIDKRISELSVAGKVIFILDQFERFFFLSPKEQARIQKIIRCLCRKNTGIIVSLREEYLADFLKRFDMNNLLSESEEKTDVPGGILKKMLSVIEIKTDTDSLVNSFLRPSKTIIWEDYNIKNNASIHLDTDNRVVMEKIGATLLYCRNQNEMDVQINGEKSKVSILESKCRKLFGDQSGSLFFNKHINEPLIEQQIIFHMAEFNQKIFLHSEEEINTFIEKNNNELLAQYFDHQLLSCKNYFHASRLLYLLSQARLRQLALKTRDLENYLFPDLFETKGHEQFMNVIEQLEEIQLIRKNTEGSGLEYEIAHDFIASAYLNYCSTNMDRNVKSALDLFIMEYMDDKRKVKFLEKISQRKDVHKHNYYRNVAYFVITTAFISYLVQRFIFNPWTTVWSDFNPYGDYVPAFPLCITVLSVIYIYNMYDKTVKYYRDEKLQRCKFMCILFAILASLAVFAYPHFLFFDGLGLAFSTLNIALLLDQRYRQACRNELLAYGAKSFMMGMVYALIHIFFWVFNNQFADFLIFSEFVMFTILLAYGFFVHMTQEVLYARMSDSSGDKL